MHELLGSVQAAQLGGPAAAPFGSASPLDYVRSDTGICLYDEFDSQTSRTHHSGSEFPPHDMMDTASSTIPGNVPSINGRQSIMIGGATEATRMEDLVRELRTLAALEASVYLARGNAKGVARPALVALHTPARRLARTMLTFGADEGVVFGLRAIRAIEAAADGCQDDVRGMFFWWSNCIQLRWMLWAMCGGAGVEQDGDAVLGDFGGLVQILVPLLRDLETHIFDQMFRHLWHNVVLPVASEEAGTVALNALPTGQQQDHKANSDGMVVIEAATKKWLGGIAAAMMQLVPAYSDLEPSVGHVRLLKQKVMGQVLRKLDAVLFGVLMSDAAGSNNPYKYNTQLPSHLLPFSRGFVSFGDGIAIKMAVTRWHHWAKDNGVDEADMETFGYFPKLRACADLLMLPKEQVMDVKIRNEIVPGLSSHDIYRLLARFKTDDFAPDPIPRGVLERLRRECASTADKSTPYCPQRYVPPSEALLLAERLIEPVALEMDHDSDEELDSIAHMYDPDSTGEGSYRFSLLRDLWSSPT